MLPRVRPCCIRETAALQLHEAANEPNLSRHRPCDRVCPGVA
jgi:hypothetical protein